MKMYAEASKYVRLPGKPPLPPDADTDARRRGVEVEVQDDVDSLAGDVPEHKQSGMYSKQKY